MVQTHATVHPDEDFPFGSRIGGREEPEEQVVGRVSQGHLTGVGLAHVVPDVGDGFTVDKKFYVKD